MFKKGLLNLLWMAVVFGLLFLWVRENEVRTAAQETIRQLEYEIDSLRNDRASAVVGLRDEMGRLETKIRDWELRYESLEAEKDEALSEWGRELEKTRSDHAAILEEKNGELSRLEAKRREEESRWTGLLEEKRSEIMSLGDQLQETSARLAEFLKKNETLEALNLDLRKSVTALEERLAQIESQKAHLTEIIKSGGTRDPVD